MARRAAVPDVFGDEHSGAPAVRAGQAAVLAIREHLRSLPPGDIVPAPDNLRLELPGLDELTASLRANGMYLPVLVTVSGPHLASVPRELDGRHLLLDGHRRTAAALRAGLQAIPALVRPVRDDRQRLEIMAEAFLGREDLTPIEEAKTFSRLQAAGFTQEEIGRMGRRGGGGEVRSQSYVSKSLDLLELPPAAQLAVNRGEINREQAYELRRLRTDPKRTQVAMRAMQRGTPAPVAVREQLAAQSLADRSRAARAEIERAGWALVDAPAQDDWLSVADGPRPLGDGIGRVPVALDRHLRLPCHAAAVSRRDGSVLHVCTRPADHAMAAVPRRSIEAERAAARESELAAAAAARRAWYVEHLAPARPAGTSATRMTRVAPVLLRHMPLPAVREALRLLGVRMRSDAEPRQVAWDWANAEGEAPPGRLDRLALALAVADELDSDDPGAVVRDAEYRRAYSVRIGGAEGERVRSMERVLAGQRRARAAQP